MAAGGKKDDAIPLQPISDGCYDLIRSDQFAGRSEHVIVENYKPVIEFVELEGENLKEWIAR